MATLVLGIDVGTTSTKVVLADPAAGVVAQASEPVALSSPHPGWAEADPAQWWANLAALVPAVLAAASAATGKPVTAADIAAVATTGMVPAVIPADDAGRPLRSAILQNDARATAEIRELAAALPGLDFVARTGSALTQQSVGPTLLWLARHEPDAWAAAATVQGSYDWLATRLGAAPHVERNWALESGLFELEPDGALTPLHPVRDALARLAGIKPEVIPPVADPGTVIGEVSRRRGRRDRPAAGHPDRRGRRGPRAVRLRRRAGEPGRLAGQARRRGRHPRRQRPPARRRAALPRRPPGERALAAERLHGHVRLADPLVPVRQRRRAGRRARSGGDRGQPRRARSACPTSSARSRRCTIPTCAAPSSACTSGTPAATCTGRSSRASPTASAITRKFSPNGGSRCVPPPGSPTAGRSPLVWKQILADALGVALEPVLDHPGAALGAALAAAVGTGSGTPAPQAWAAAASVPGMVTIGAPIEPDPAHAARYAEAYQIYRDAGAALTPISHRLATRSMS